MAIPELKSAFCGSSVRTGCKVIGWLNMILGILEFLVFAIGVGIVVAVVNKTEDKVIGKEAIKAREEIQKSMYPASPEVQVEQNPYNAILALFVGDSDTSDPEVLGRQVKENLQGFFTMVFVIVLVFFVIHSLVQAILLIGTYKRKSSYVGFYLALSILGLIFSFFSLFSSSTFNLKIFVLLAFFVNLYFTWVIYSFYRELRRPQCLSTRIPGHKLLDGDVPMIIPENNFNYYPQK